MQRLQAFKFELRPNGGQERDMHRFAGACRFVYNRALAWQKANHEAGGKFIGYVAMAKHLTAWRNGAETPWLKEAPVHPLQHALKDLDRAYQNFFAQRAAFPKFAKRGQRDSFRYPDPKQFKLDQANGRIFLSDLEPNGLTGSKEGQYIRWQRCAGAKVVSSSYGTQGQGETNTSLQGMGPSGNTIAAAAGTAVMFVEVIYDYRPIVPVDLIGYGSKTLRFTSAFNVRQRNDQVLKNASALATAATSACTIYSA